MDTAKFEIDLPSDVYERAQQIAQASDRSVESVILDGLRLLFGKLPETNLSPDELTAYRDDQLWAIVHHRLAWPQETRLQQLIEQGKQATLSESEQSEMERLLDLVDHQMLLRSKALLLLKQRGYDVESEIKLGA